MTDEKPTESGARKQARTVAAQAKFLAAFRKTGVILLAAETAEIHRSTHYDWMKTDPVYAQRFADAEDDAADVVEAELFRRGTVGRPRFKFYRGKPVYWRGPDGTGPVRHYQEQEVSDACLIVCAKARRPEKFRERGAIEISGPDGSPVSVVHSNLDLVRKIHRENPRLAQELLALADSLDAEHDANRQAVAGSVAGNGRVTGNGEASS